MRWWDEFWVAPATEESYILPRHLDWVICQPGWHMHYVSITDMTCEDITGRAGPDMVIANQTNMMRQKKWQGKTRHAVTPPLGPYKESSMALLLPIAIHMHIHQCECNSCPDTATQQPHVYSSPYANLTTSARCVYTTIAKTLELTGTYTRLPCVPATTTRMLLLAQDLGVQIHVPGEGKTSLPPSTSQDCTSELSNPRFPVSH